MSITATTNKTALALLLGGLCASASAADYSPYVGADAPKKLLWGDTHVHTAWSADAGAAGDRLGPEASLRFSRGEEVTTSTGQKARLDRPLDWVVIADHAEGMGLIQQILAKDAKVMADPLLRKWAEMIARGGKEAGQASADMAKANANPAQLPDMVKGGELLIDAWKKLTNIVEKYNEPGRFTSLIGYEWSSHPGGDNLHRNVIFRDGVDKAQQVRPFSSWDSENPQDLWAWMQQYEQQTGGQMLAIPHNANLSNGRMFALADLVGNPLTREYAEARSRWEPVYEATQIKGDSEAHALMSPTDEFSNFERWDTHNLVGVPKGDKREDMLTHEYAREALKNGLLLENQLGANPFKFGMIGSTDTHTSLSSADEDNFWGKLTNFEPNPTRALEQRRQVTGWQYSASGRAAVWAQDNSREAIWDALKRKEVYASSGPRMTLRLFAGYDFAAADLARSDWATLGYAKGVPMGGQLAAVPAGKVPTLMIQAARDPLGANLDRVQVIKGWVDAQGQTQEKIYDVAWGPAADSPRQIDAHGKLTPVGNTVDIKDASYSNSIGAPALQALWRDPDFDAALRAFYYVRVLQIPTPRWTAYDAKRFDVTMPAEVPMILQDRAYSSPVWYSPGKG